MLRGHLLPSHPLHHFTILKSMKALFLRNRVVLMEILHSVLDSHLHQGWRTAGGHFHVSFLALTWRQGGILFPLVFGQRKRRGH